jgi:murein DD-endopeptidase MepM/ murein hydrolase activator NlpD
MINMKTFPLKKDKIYISADSQSFINRNYNTETEVLVGGHVGAFGTMRKNHCHEGVDLYCMPNDEVYAMEDGVVVLIEDFTGAKINMPWWNDTRAVHIEGISGVINYGEIKENEDIYIGKKIKQGDCIGKVVTVLLKDKGRPMTMLHLELYKSGSCESVTWNINEPQPSILLNPTHLLISAIKDNQLSF